MPEDVGLPDHMLGLYSKNSCAVGKAEAWVKTSG